MLPVRSDDRRKYETKRDIVSPMPYNLDNDSFAVTLRLLEAAARAIHDRNRILFYSIRPVFSALIHSRFGIRATF